MLARIRPTRVVRIRMSAARRKPPLKSSLVAAFHQLNFRHPSETSVPLHRAPPHTCIGLCEAGYAGRSGRCVGELDVGERPVKVAQRDRPAPAPLRKSASATRFINRHPLVERRAPQRSQARPLLPQPPPLPAPRLTMPKVAKAEKMSAPMRETVASRASAAWAESPASVAWAASAARFEDRLECRRFHVERDRLALAHQLQSRRPCPAG